MSILVRYNPPSLTAEQYEEGDRLLREVGVESPGGPPEIVEVQEIRKR